MGTLPGKWGRYPISANGNAREFPVVQFVEIG